MAATATQQIIPRGAPLPVRFCRECGHPFYPARQDQDFCRAECRRTYHHRRTERGVAVYDFVMEWRGKRIKGGFTEFCRIVDGFLAADRERRKRHAELRKAYQDSQKARAR